MRVFGSMWVQREIATLMHCVMISPIVSIPYITRYESVRTTYNASYSMTFSTLSNTEGKYGQAGCGARCIDAALLGRRQ